MHFEEFLEVTIQNFSFLVKTDWPGVSVLTNEKHPTSRMIGTSTDNTVNNPRVICRRQVKSLTILTANFVIEYVSLGNSCFHVVLAMLV